MGRKKLEDKVTESSIEKQRKVAIEKFFGLTEKVLKHIQWSIESTRVCNSCSVKEVNGVEIHIAGKAKDAEGKCVFCHGLNVVPDVQQRNWATGEIADRIAPKPKSVEMSVEQKSNVEELEDEMKRLPTEQLEQQVKILSFSSDILPMTGNGG